MGRIRTVKPELFQHSDLFDAEEESKLPLRLAFIGLFTCCDRAGRFKWRPRQLKVAILPYDEFDFSRVLDALLTRGFIVKYVVENEVFGVIPSWSTHQSINNKEPESKLPEPIYNQVFDASITRESPVDDALTTRGVKEGKGKEGKGKEVASLPDWVPSEPWEAFVRYRKKCKAPWTEDAVALTLRELEKLKAKGENVGAVLEQSIQRGWTGVFPLKGDLFTNGNGQPKKPLKLAVPYQ